MPKFTHLIVAALLAFLPAFADASLIAFTDAGSFQAAVGRPLKSVNFDGLSPDGTGVWFPTPPGLSLPGVTFSIDPAKSDGDLFVMGKDFYYLDQSSLCSQQSTTGINDLTLTFAAPADAVGLNLGSFYGGSLSFTLSDGTSYALNSTAIQPNLGFIGLVSSSPFQSIAVDGQSAAALGQESIDVQGASFDVVPVPVYPAILLGLAFLWMLLVRRPVV